MAANMRSAAVAKRAAAPENGGSSTLLNRIATEFAPPKTITPANAARVTLSGRAVVETRDKLSPLPRRW